MPENQPIEPLEPMNNNPSGKSRPVLLLLQSRCSRCLANPALALTVPVAQDTSSNASGKLISKAGTAGMLTVADDQHALLEFDLSSLEVVPATIDRGNIKSVILEVYVIKTNTAANCGRRGGKLGVERDVCGEERAAPFHRFHECAGDDSRTRSAEQRICKRGHHGGGGGGVAIWK